jgi:hypothetical protein
MLYNFVAQSDTCIHDCKNSEGAVKLLKSEEKLHYSYTFCDFASESFFTDYEGLEAVTNPGL